MTSVMISQLQLHSRTCLEMFKSLQITTVRYKRKLIHKPRLRNPVWFVKVNQSKHDDGLTNENTEYIKSVVFEKFGSPIIKHGIETFQNPVQSIVNIEELPKQEWTPGTRRAGLIARKIGVYPMWTKDGKKFLTTLLQVVDNHVIKYIPPDQYEPAQKPNVKDTKKWGCLMVGALSTDPTLLTKEYCGLFQDSGVMPKAVLHRFLVSPTAALPAGTPLNATHFRVGDFVDIRGKTIDRGFQGVCKRWGFKGMPASHGVTKTHRRPGNIGGGGEKGRVWPGQKMPGHMGNRWRKLKGLMIWRINTKYNVLWVSGHNVPGETNSLCYIYDTILPLRKAKDPPPFPTAVERDDLPEEIIYEKLHDFREPTITFENEGK